MSNKEKERKTGQPKQLAYSENMKSNIITIKIMIQEHAIKI
jgi:hypothetical protein